MASQPRRTVARLLGMLLAVPAVSISIGLIVLIGLISGTAITPGALPGVVAEARGETPVHALPAALSGLLPADNRAGPFFDAAATTTSQMVGQLVPRRLRRRAIPRDNTPQTATQTEAKGQDEVAKPHQTEAKGQDEVAKPQSSTPQFIRLLKKDDEPMFLQTAIVRYKPTSTQQQNWPKNLRIDLVGVIHIAERAYYEDLNKRFQAYDVVLYELVAPEGTRVTPGQSSNHPVSVLQQGMTNLLGLTHQLDAIDYNRPNFVHADMSPQEFTEAMRERGESMWTTFLRAFGYQWAKNMTNESQPSDLEVLNALFRQDREWRLKRIFAEQLADDVEGSVRAIEGPSGSTLISGRNERVLEVLQKQVSLGKRTIAVLYGAGHMPHFHQRFVELGLTPTKTIWLNAWDLREPASSPANSKSGNN